MPWIKASLSLLRNNLLSLFCYFVISVAVYLLAGYSSLIVGHQPSEWDLLFSIPLLIATPILFILAGRYALKFQGSGITDLISVFLVCLLGLICTPHMAFFKPKSVGDLNVASFYFSYITPLAFTGQVFKNNWDPWGQGVSALYIGSLYSVIPTILMWLGVRWRGRKHPTL